MKKKRKLIGVIQKDDFKSRMWVQYSNPERFEWHIQPSSAIFSPFFLLKLMISNFLIPDFFVLRYLNDYPSFVKSVLRFLSELILISICLLFRIKIFWICHNIDKETEANFPKLTRWRRNLVFRFANVYFVTDPLLIDSFKEYFNVRSKRVYSATFGEIPIKILKENKVNQNYAEHLAKNFINNQLLSNLNGDKILVTLCAGTLNGGGVDKVIHFDYLPILIKHAKECGFHVIAIIAGNWEENLPEIKKLDKIYSEYSNHILNFKGYTKFSDSFIRDNIDFYFRGYKDISVPFTIYEACSYAKPTIALNTGFLPSLIGHNNIGEIVGLDMASLEQALLEISSNKKYNFTGFLNSHKWGLMSKNIEYEYQKD